ncbi:hypothetical protein [Microbispora rosea]|uniref:hypothetical protein n=1 Tax=Microbispora rosea TaxID=58117 RepID=UPI00378A0A37
MPGIDHEMPLELIRNRPETALELLRCVQKVDIPPHVTARLETVDCTAAPIEFRADSVVVLRDETGTALMAVIVEVQLRRDSGKRFSWPVYVTTLRSQHRCDTVLLVICPDRSMARWCERTIRLGPSGVVTPLAIDPGRVPLITDPDQARACPEFAVLSAVAHPDEADDEPVLQAMLAGLKTLDREHRTLYLNYVFRSLPEVTIKRLEEMVTTIRDFEDLGKKYFSHWVAEGQIKTILNVLDSRGLEVSDDTRERIQRCEDTNQLDAWARKVGTITSVEELFAE